MRYAALVLATFVWLNGLLVQQACAVDEAQASADEFAEAFNKHVQPFFAQHCLRCHNVDEMTSGIRVDHLTSAMEDKHLRLWDGIRHQIERKAMPPNDEPQPSDAERQQIIDWITRGLDEARKRPTPKNGGVRRLTVAQYRNTIRELLLLEDDVADVLPPDAVSRDGFVNNQDTLTLSPLLLETYLDIAEQALDRVIVDPETKPVIQNFRMDLGAAINPEPCPDNLILGADSLLLNNADLMVTQLTAKKPFDFNPFAMQTKFRFIEGYQGNDTVRGWREYDSIYHAVYACMRGTHGYPKGLPYSTVPEGLLLRPAIPSVEEFGVESTYGPKANFKVSLRELPDYGRFRVTVTAAKYDDGLLFDPGAPTGNAETANAVTCLNPTTPQTVTITQPGIYQVDVHKTDRASSAIAADASRLENGLIGAWGLNGSAVSTPEHDELVGQLAGDVKFVKSPFGQAASFDGDGDAIVIPRDETMNVGAGDFSVAAWIHPKQLRQAGIICLGKYSWTHGWYFDMPGGNGVLRIETVSPGNQPNGTVASPPGMIRANRWQHVTAVVRRGENQTRLFVNGFEVAKGTIAAENLDNPKVDLHLGRIQDSQQFWGEIDEVRIYRRALDESEIQALLEPGRKFVRDPTPDKPEELRLTLGQRQFVGTLKQPAFLAVRLPAGDLAITASSAGNTSLNRIVLTPLDESGDVAQKFTQFEKRSPRIGVHVGLRRDCGSTLSPVGEPQAVSSDELTSYQFEGAIRNFPSPDVEKENENYLAGIREIGVRSEYTDGRDMPRLLIRSVEFEGPLYETWPPASHRNIFIESVHSDEPAAYARDIIRNFATRAFRRPITAVEESSLMNVFTSSSAGGASFRDSVKDALQVVLTSPQFLFLIENSPSPAAEPLAPYELASKLSFFLWNGPPDRELLNAASTAMLIEQLDSHIERMINDSRFDQFIRPFTSQWLALEKFDVLEPDRARFPQLTRDTRTQLRREPEQFLKHLIRNNMSVRQLIDSDFVLANEVTSSYYDLPEDPDTGFEFIAIPHQRTELGGLLTQPAILAGLSDGREPNPVKRGAWFARKFISEPPDDPPPNVPVLEEDTKHLSLRERLEKHRNQPGCVQCHLKIDPWGVPFEEFDAGGRLSKQTVDAHSVLPDNTNVTGVQDLKRYLANDRIDQVAFSVLRHLTVYAIGRDLTYNETLYLKQNALSLKANGYLMQDLIRFVVHSPMFLEK